MILVMTEESDFSANYTCQWLNYWKAPYKRINKNVNSFNQLEKIRLSNAGIQINLEELSNEDISVTWNRRGYFHISALSTEKLITSEASKGISKHLKGERETLIDFLYTNVGDSNINTPKHYNSNKLLSLQTATKVGFSIPNTLITKSKDDLKLFMNDYPRIITKNIQDFASFDYNGRSYVQRTTEITAKNLGKIPDKFYYSVFQECIDRRFEIRVFHFQGENHAVAIIFPEDIVDSRQVVNNKINRMTPFLLPMEMDLKINDFMKEMELESGSLDIIYDKQGEFVFIEVNPVGQYDYVDKVGNFMLDKKIAQFLKNTDDDFRRTI